MERSKYISELAKRASEGRRFMQVVAGARQVGKTTIINQFLDSYPHDSIYESADSVTGSSRAWLEQVWNSARLKIRTGSPEVLLVIDEVQKLPDWSELVKKLWDEDSRSKANIKVILSGSSRLLIEKGLTESLHGRFELIQVPHWSFPEMREAFGFSLEEYIYFGGYPGPAPLIQEEKRWKSYLRDSIIETSISKDILMLTTITKPALLRQLFELGAAYSSQVLPFNKMLGSLTDAGNTVTLSHYLELLDQARFLGGLQKYSGSTQRSRSSSPKLQVYNNALFAAMCGKSFSESKAAPDLWGRFVESCVGSHLVNSCMESGLTLTYWRDGNDEVDFVIAEGDRLCGIEVKSGRRLSNKGMDVFKQRYPSAKVYVVSSQAAEGSGCIRLEDFLTLSPEVLL